jgi:hypothetical protein
MLKRCGGNNWDTENNKRNGCHTEALEVRCGGQCCILSEP